MKANLTTPPAHGVRLAVAFTKAGRTLCLKLKRERKGGEITVSKVYMHHRTHAINLARKSLGNGIEKRNQARMRLPTIFAAFGWRSKALAEAEPLDVEVSSPIS